MGGQARWGFDRSRFFDAALDPDRAVEHLTSVINKSTDKDPLYLIVGGPMELIYRAMEAVRAECASTNFTSSKRALPVSKATRSRQLRFFLDPIRKVESGPCSGDRSLRLRGNASPPETRL
jgi:hypothetical protein